jgi:methionyl-tRNA formyltransferase
MEMNSRSGLRRQVAIVAKHPFYAEDIRNALTGLEIKIVSSGDIWEIQEHIDAGTNFDFIFFPHYSKVISEIFLERSHCIGFHTGDLPGDRGGSPIQHKILRGEYDTFVSAMKLVNEIDAGDVLCDEPISLEHGSIEEILKNISKVIARMTRLILTEKLTPRPQIGSVLTSKRLKPQESELDLESLNVRGIYDRIRMLDGLDYPPAHIKVGPHKIVLSNAQLKHGKLTFSSQLEEK